MKKKLYVVMLAVLLASCTSNRKLENMNENSTVVYEIFVGSFYDSNEDGIGDLKGITSQLDYLQTLGIGEIWLTPIHPSDSYHKYDVLDYKAVDPSFGTMEDFEELVQEAKKRNIGILLDLVLNHTSVNHPWFIEAKENQLNNTCGETNKCEYYNFTTQKESNTTKLSTKLYYQTVFGSHMPDLNLSNEDVKTEIKSIVSFWLDKGIAGFRLDAPLHYYGSADKNNVFLSWLNDTVKAIKSDALIVGEVWSDEATILSHYESNVDSFFNFPASSVDGKIVTTIRSKSGQDLAEWIVNNNNKINAINPNAINSMFLSNHDQGRSAAFFANNNDQARLMVNVMMLSPGMPYLYYGEEIGMLGSGIDQNKRLAMPWGYKNDKGQCVDPKDSNYAVELDTTVTKQMKDNTSLWTHYQQAIQLRNQYTSWIGGNYEVIDLHDPTVFAIKQVKDNEIIYVIHNFDTEVKTIEMDEQIAKATFLDKLSTAKDSKISLQPLSSVLVEIGR